MTDAPNAKTAQDMKEDYAANAALVWLWIGPRADGMQMASENAISILGDMLSRAFDSGVISQKLISMQAPTSTALDQARAQEREACAKLCDQFMRPFVNASVAEHDIAAGISKAIRDRSRELL